MGAKSALAAGYICEFCDREFSTEKGAALHERDWCPDNPESRKSQGEPVGRQAGAAIPDQDAKPVEKEKAPAEPSPYDEPPPGADTKPGWRERLWGNKVAPPAPVGERRPRKRRRSTEGIWQLLWTGGGTALVRTGADIPVGNVLTFQAPIVGPVMDDVIAGTFIDTLLQPLAGQGERLKKADVVLRAPMCVFLMERFPAMVPALEPLLRQAIRDNLVEFAKMAKAQKKADESYRRALTDLGMDPGDDPVNEIIDQIWAGMPQPAQNGQAAHADVTP